MALTPTRSSNRVGRLQPAGPDTADKTTDQATRSGKNRKVSRPWSGQEHNDRDAGGGACRDS